jgi:four helix bundle protein
MKREFAKLDLWKQAHSLALEVFRHTRKIAQTRRKDLAEHICGVAFGVPSSIAMGCENGGDAAFQKALLEAKASADDLRIQFSVLHDLGLMDDRDYLSRPKLNRFLKRTEEVDRMVTEEISKLPTPDQKGARTSPN